MALLSPKEGAILVINSGSSSLKLSLFAWVSSTFTLCASALAEEIYSPQVCLKYETPTGKSFQKNLGAFCAQNRLEALLLLLAEEEPRFAPTQLTAVGHRIVHGGAHTHSVQIDAALLEALEDLMPLAPLHNPAAIASIKEAMKATGEIVPHVAVFDTAFHRTLPPSARYYGIPYLLSQRHQIERYGFHGIAHKALWDIYARQIAPQKPAPRKIITVHLGNGCSMTAIEEGISKETSMGYTPAEGLLMGTRAGNIDAGVIEALCRLENCSIQQVLRLLNEQSGLLGVSCVSSDLRQVLKEAATSEPARLALDLFCHRIRLYLGAYLALLGGAEAILFSGGIGENSAWVREKVLSDMQWCGILLDQTRNDLAYQLAAAEVRPLQAQESSIALYAVGANENRAIAEEVVHVLQDEL